MPRTRHAVLILNHGYKSPFKELDIQYARLFDPQRYEVTIVYLTGQPDHESPPAAADYRILFLNLSKKKIRGLKLHAIRELQALCRKRRFSVAICHRYKPTYIMSWVARTCRIPFLLSVMHDFGTLRRLSHKLFVYTRLRHQFVFAGVSDAVREDLYRNGWGLNREQVITLPNSIDVHETAANQLSREGARSQLRLAPDDFVVGTVGRLHPAKDHLTLIRATARAVRDRPALKLVIIGEGPLRPHLQDAIKAHHLEDHVLLTGFVPDASRLMKAFDVYVSASRKEPFGMVLLEAMAARIPIVATAVDGVPQVMGELGDLVPPENPAVLAAAIINCAQRTPEELAARGDLSWQRVTGHFTTEKFRDVFWNFFGPRGLEQ